MDDILAPPPDGLGLSTPTNAPTNHVVSDRVVPRVTAGPVELRPLMTDPFLAYLLSRIDGVRTFGEMVALGSLSRPEWEAGLLTLLALDAVDLTFGDLE